MRYLLMTTLLALAACASRPTIRSDQDPAARFANYQTWGFVSELGTDRAGYSTLVTAHFRDAVSREMDARGLRRSDDNPDLLVNFFTSMRERVETRSTPDLVGTGYYRSRFGFYSAWPLYGRDVSTITYKVGTASIDVIDAERRQLVWEGVAEGRLTDKVLDDPRPAIDSAVHEIFQRFPIASAATRR